MPASIMQVARTLGQIGRWTLSNLELQKIAYIGEMLHLGRDLGPLISENWQAWAYGPVQPSLYHKAKVFGTSPVKDIFLQPFLDPSDSGYVALRDAYEAMAGMNPGQMVGITHRRAGAWARHYRPDEKGVIIPKSAIKEEYAELITE